MTKKIQSSRIETRKKILLFGMCVFTIVLVAAWLLQFARSLSANQELPVKNPSEKKDMRDLQELGIEMENTYREWKTGIEKLQNNLQEASLTDDASNQEISVKEGTRAQKPIIELPENE